MSGALRGVRPAGLVALVVGAAFLVLILDVRSTVRRQLEASGATAEDRRDAADRRVTEAVAQAVEGASAEHALQRAALETQLADARQALDAAATERDRAVADGSAAASEAATLRGRVAELESETARLEADLSRREDEKRQLLGENSRLLDQVLEGDRKLEVLNRSLGEVRARRESEAQAAGVVITGRGESLATRASEALRRSGAGQTAMLEARLGDDGSLTDLLVRLAEDELQPARLVAARQATLVALRGRALLRLEGLSGDVGDAGAHLDLDLPAFDAAAWMALGMQPPAAFRAVGDASTALAELLQRQGWQLDALQGIEGEMLHGLELSQVEPTGEVRRTLRAARGTLGAGPELTLWEGSVVTGGDERPFFGGVFRLPLPGLDAAAWKSALAPAAP